MLMQFARQDWSVRDYVILLTMFHLHVPVHVRVHVHVHVCLAQIRTPSLCTPKRSPIRADQSPQRKRLL